MKRSILCLFSAAFSVAAPADERSLTPKATAQSPVLDRQEYASDRGELIFERIAPPKLAKPQSAAPAQAPTPEEIAAWRGREAKAQQFIQLSATVIDRRVSILRWSDATTEYHAVSNIDFHYLCGVGDFETADTVFTFFMGIGSETFSAEERAAGALERRLAEFGLTRLPAPHEFPSQSPSWRLIRTVPVRIPGVTTSAAIDALHAHFARHREECEASWRRREAARLEAEQRRRENPPPPERVRVRFWAEKPVAVEP